MTELKLKANSRHLSRNGNILVLTVNPDCGINRGSMPLKVIRRLIMEERDLKNLVLSVMGDVGGICWAKTSC